MWNSENARLFDTVYIQKRCTLYDLIINSYVSIMIIFMYSERKSPIKESKLTEYFGLYMSENPWLANVWCMKITDKCRNRDFIYLYFFLPGDFQHGGFKKAVSTKAVSIILWSSPSMAVSINGDFHTCFPYTWAVSIMTFIVTMAVSIMAASIMAVSNWFHDLDKNRLIKWVDIQV